MPNGYIQKKALDFSKAFGAENEARTRDPNLGKVVLYQLSYFRVSVLRVQRYVLFLKLQKKMQLFSRKLHFFEFFSLFTLNDGLKLSQEPYIILKIVSQILNLPFKHCNSLHTHSKSKTGILL